MFVKEVHYLNNHDEVLNAPSMLDDVRSSIKNGDVFVFKNVYPKGKLLTIREYLIKVGQSSLPNYMKIEEGCPNFHRMNVWDKRSYVLACFHQFVFFPWNQDLFNFFELFKPVYNFRNIINSLPKNKFLGVEAEDGCTARLAFQFYPRGIGGMNEHIDPIDFHQLTVPMMIMSTKGKDFYSGGAYLEKSNDEKIVLDDIADCGDVIYFNAGIPHGVDKIDPDCKVDWYSFSGRWMLLFAVNKLFDNAKIDNAVDLEEKSILVT